MGRVKQWVVGCQKTRRYLSQWRVAIGSNRFPLERLNYQSPNWCSSVVWCLVFGPTHLANIQNCLQIPDWIPYQLDCLALENVSLCKIMGWSDRKIFVQEDLCFNFPQKQKLVGWTFHRQFHRWLGFFGVMAVEGVEIGHRWRGASHPWILRYARSWDLCLTGIPQTSSKCFLFIYNLREKHYSKISIIFKTFIIKQWFVYCLRIGMLFFVWDLSPQMEVLVRRKPRWSWPMLGSVKGGYTGWYGDAACRAKAL